GYPTDMLALDLDLEADLGIDTVKQAEIFAELRSGFGLPRREDLKLRDYPTLGHLIKLVGELRGGSASTSTTPPAPAPAAAPAATSAAARIAATVIRRAPVPVLRPDLDLCLPTGVVLTAGARVIIVPDQSGVAGALAAYLEQRGLVPVIAGPADLEEQLAGFTATPVLGVFHLAALDLHADLTTAPPAVVDDLLGARLRRLARLCRALLPGLGRAGSFLVAATRLGGLHGYGPVAPADPAGGAVAGFVKAFGREHPDATVKVVDFEAAAAPAFVAHALLIEAERDPGAVEIGHAFDARHAIGLTEEPAPARDPARALGPDHVVLVTGAAGGITAAITAELAAASRATFYLLDLAPAPAGADPDLARVLTDRDGLRRDLCARAAARGERVTPAQVERVLGDLERQAAVADLCRRVEAAGGHAAYRSLDVRDPAAVAAVVDEIRARHGRLDVVMHAAGLERSRLLEDKPQDEFDRVFGVKALGLCHLLRATADLPVQALVLFSSVAGRFGNGGQTDYSAANDFLCKTALALPRLRPGLRALALDWTAWAGAGMATRGSIPEMMRRAGIDMLPLDEGVPVVRAELEAGTRGELVIGKGLGQLVAPRHETGGLDVAALERRLTAADRQPMISRVLRLDLYEGLGIETLLDPEAEPFLRDHAIDGTPVLPGVMGLEGFAEVARLLLPGYHVAGIEDVRFEAPLKYYRRKPRPGLFRARLRRISPDVVLADLTLSAERSITIGEQFQETRHFSGTVRLSRVAGDAPGLAPPVRRGRPVSEADIYRIFFHGPSYRVLEGVEVGDGALHGTMRADLPPELARPGETLLSPRAIELCLQTAGVYEIGATGRLALPAAIDRIIAHAAPPRSATLRAEVTPRTGAGGLSFDARVCDLEGRVYLELNGYRTSALPAGLPDELVEPLRAAVRGGAA
ncbi:MAG TPA: SDR family NAD(P)-dependent oxidoreductase, partial [Polyangia bacterium]